MFALSLRRFRVCGVRGLGFVRGGGEVVIKVSWTMSVQVLYITYLGRKRVSI